jgi:two-component system, OmpR family, response regulator
MFKKINKMAVKILVVEDEQVLRENLRELLEMESYEVKTAANGVEGLRALHSYLPDLILCDIKMVEMDGYEFIRSLRNSPAFTNIPFIYLSAKVEKDDIRQGMNLGADDYLLKPFKRAELLKAIEVRLRRKEEFESAVTNKQSEEKQRSEEERNQFSLLIQTLTRTERKIVMSIAEGLTTNDIAEKFFISPKTVENHRYNIAKKLKLQGANSVLAFALTNRRHFLKNSAA